METTQGRREWIKSEEDVYQKLGLYFIPPRSQRRLWRNYCSEREALFLIEKKDLRGTFHCHTVDSDGQNTLEEMGLAAQKLGWEYIGIADHSKSATKQMGCLQRDCSRR